MKVVTFGEIMLRLAPEGYLRFTQAEKFGAVYGGGEEGVKVYTEKLKAMNAMIMEISGDESKQKTFSGFLNECWQYAMEHSDTQLKTAQKPVKADKKG